MKSSTTVVLLICFAISMNSCSQDYRKLSESEVDSKKARIANDFATNFLKKLNSGAHYEFTDEATETFKQKFDQQSQTAVSQQLNNNFGEYKSLEYSETWIKISNPEMNIFRFKGDFAKGNRKLEIRVVLNKDDKISGFWIKPWSDIFK